VAIRLLRALRASAGRGPAEGRQPLARAGNVTAVLTSAPLAAAPNS